MKSRALRIPEIWAARYVLRSKGSLNAKSHTRERQGALLRVLTGAGEGFADLHPWTELGDLPLQLQLEALASDAPTDLGRRSLALAKLDAEARSRSESAFDGLTIPESHFLVSDLERIKNFDLDQIRDHGFNTLKIKLGRELASEFKLLCTLENELSNFRLRLDFNAAVTEVQLIAFFDGLPEGIKNAIEFLEDPLPWQEADWARLSERLGFSFALDRLQELQIEALERRRRKGFEWLICKPAVQEPSRISSIAQNQAARLCVTSYLDHPVGQVGAALEAGYLLRDGVAVGTCGLLSHFAYEKDAFSEAVRCAGPRLIAPPGIGIGFDDLLKSQAWVRISR
jgi:O-succinylbenzoate synthase